MAPEEASTQDTEVEETTATDEVDAPEAEAAEPEAGGDSTDWKSYARKHERQAKKATKQLEDLQAELAKAKEATQTEQEKAIDQAKREAAEQAKAEVMKELKDERLKAAVARTAAGKFADVEDAIKLLDLDDDIFDEDGKVNTESLDEALTDLLDRKPHLAASPVGKKPAGDADAGKGSGKSKALEDMSVEEHLASIRRHK